MNVVFGSAGAPAHGFGEWRTRLERTYAQPVTSAVSTPALATGTMGDAGAVLGVARQGRMWLAYLGSIHRPLPGFSPGSPLDNPDVTAAFLLQRYRRAGRSIFSEIRGHYALAIADVDTGTLMLAVGPGSIRHLLYAERDGDLVFATNLHSLVSGLGDSARLDRSYEDFLLIYGFLPFSRTPFVGAKVLPPGTWLQWTAGQVSMGRIEANDARAEPLSRPDPSMSFDEGVERLYTVFMSAMEDQAASHPEAAVLLGGFDSGLVAAALKRLGKNVTTWSYGYGDTRYDQTHTDTLSSFLGTRHEWVRVGAEEFRAGLERYAQRYNMVSNWPSYIIQSDTVCAQVRARGFTFCYTGDGCDDAFMGFPRVYGRARVYHALGRLAPWISSVGVALLSPAILERRIGHPWRVALNVLRTLGGEWPAGRFLTFRIFDELSLARLRNDMPPPPQERSHPEILRELTRGLDGLTPARLAFQGKSGIGTNRTKIVGCSDGNGVSILSPYLHPAVRTFAQGLPEAFLRPPGKPTMTGLGKYILLEMAERKGLLPREFIYQKKISAVEAPADQWYFGPLNEFARRRLAGLPFTPRAEYVDSLLRPKIAEHIYREHISSDHLTTHGLSLLLTYASLAALAQYAEP